MPGDFSPNVERFNSLAERYNAARPSPPPAVVDLLCTYAGADPVGCVVDIGCGTGLSTRIWGDRARSVVGVEPNAEMRAKAEAASRDLRGVAYRDDSSGDTGLPDGVADVVTCSQSLHWMEPGPTFAEADRLLRPGGVFAAIDCDWPPVVDWRVEQAYEAMRRKAAELEAGHPGIRARRWPKDRHLANLRECGRFAFVREVLLHGGESGGAERVVNIALSQGGVAALLRLGVDEETLGLARLRRVAHEVLGGRSAPFVFCYRVRVGVKAPAARDAT